MVSPGASVTEGQPVMELETDKAVVEVPSSVSGTVKEIRVKEGEKIKVGQVIFTVENGAGAKAAKAVRAQAQLPPQRQRRTPAAAEAPAPPARTSRRGSSHRSSRSSAAPAQLRAQPNSSCPNWARTSIRAIWCA